MNAEQDPVRELARRIARRVEDSSSGTPVDSPASVEGDLASLTAGLRRIEKRLAHIELHLGHDDQAHYTPGNSALPAASASRSPWSRSALSLEHPSAEKFGVDETVSELVDYFEREKVCALEPGGKPCDHCAMCSSRGF